jgi:uncharacterized damage-inducible protein DinB
MNLWIDWLFMVAELWTFKFYTSNKKTMKINRKTAIKTLLLGGATLPVLGKTQQEKDFLGFRDEFALAWKSSQEYTLKIYNQMPEDKMEYKYTPESFSWRTQFVHCIVFTAAQLAGRLNIANPYDSKSKDFWKKLNKSELEIELNAFYAWVEKTVSEVSAEKLSQMEAFAGGNIPVWRLFYALENHIIHHRGQAICYLRLNGITPTGYIGW